MTCQCHVVRTNYVFFGLKKKNSQQYFLLVKHEKALNDGFGKIPKTQSKTTRYKQKIIFNDISGCF